MLEFSCKIDPDALAKIKQFSGWKAVLEEELLKAHKKADEALQDAAKANMHWKNPSGWCSQAARSPPQPNPCFTRLIQFISQTK